jgi:TolB-like protein
MKNTKLIAILVIILLASCSTKKSVSVQTKSKPDKVTEVGDQGDQKERIAVLDLKTVGFPAEKGRIVSELIRTDLINSNRFIVIERSQMDAIFKEQGFQQAGCTDQDCAVKIGKLLAARKMLIGNVMKVGESIMVTARIVDVEKGVAENSGKAQSESEESLVPEISTLVASLTGEAPSNESHTIIPKITLKLSKNSYKTGEDIVVTYKKFPGTKYDYISIAKENEPARNHYSYQYTNRQTEGTVTFYGGVRDAGKYEVRSHTNYDKGDIQPTAILKFTVK